MVKSTKIDDTASVKNTYVIIMCNNAVAQGDAQGSETTTMLLCNMKIVQ
jgi:hypothetical protein